MSDTKKCPRCGEEKPRIEFRSLKNRVHPYCRPCEKAHGKQRRRLVLTLDDFKRAQDKLEKEMADGDGAD